jgi:TPR repeat protein
MAAEQGHVKAQYLMGVSAECGHGVVQSDEDAARWYRRAADQGCAAAQFAAAQFSLGAILSEGRDEVQSE